MWFIFPQLAGLGRSRMATQYALSNQEEARAYLEHPILGGRLLEISRALLNLSCNNAHEIFGSPDDLKLRSSMTLFATLHNSDIVFEAVLQKFFGGNKDVLTLKLLSPD